MFRYILYDGGSESEQTSEVAQAEVADAGGAESTAGDAAATSEPSATSESTPGDNQSSGDGTEPEGSKDLPEFDWESWDLENIDQVPEPYRPVLDKVLPRLRAYYDTEIQRLARDADLYKALTDPETQSSVEEQIKKIEEQYKQKLAEESSSRQEYEKKIQEYEQKLQAAEATINQWAADEAARFEKKYERELSDPKNLNKVAEWMTAGIDPDDTIRLLRYPEKTAKLAVEYVKRGVDPQTAVEVAITKSGGARKPEKTLSDQLASGAGVMPGSETSARKPDIVDLPLDEGRLVAIREAFQKAQS